MFYTADFVPVCVTTVRVSFAHVPVPAIHEIVDAHLGPCPLTAVHRAARRLSLA